MDEAFLGEIFLIALNYAPIGFELCNGQELPISGNEALFSLLGNTYGGDGISTFRLPDLQGRIPLCTNNSYPLGEAKGTADKPLTAAHISGHTHSIAPGAQIQMKTGTTADASSPANAYPAPVTGKPRFSYQADDKMMALNVTEMTTPQGAAFTTDLNATANQRVNNMMPGLCMNYVIATQGIYPSGGTKTSQQMGDIIMAAFQAPPRGYALCNGAAMSIAQNQALFAVLGDLYKPYTTTAFYLPNLQGKVPIGPRQGPGLSLYNQGVEGGIINETLTASQLPPHTHNVKSNSLSLPAGDNNNTHNPVGAFSGTSTTGNLYSLTAGPGVSASLPATLTVNNGTTPPALDNMQPYLSVQFFIAITGLFPPRS
ncbi:phage tail protein [Chitinophaga varians]|uniref:phage tail protein n=1 Tax=Chitinophaga varians TaxID=2202339 RepID=UPI00165F742C|nr:tail fiber protein [Chitinophaga varians]MBC9909479.1 tail fiber protein [Chitinophaga varians]